MVKVPSSLEELYTINSTIVYNPKSGFNKQQGVSGEFGWVGFLVVCFLYKINLNPRKIICCGKKWPIATFSFYFSLGWVGLGLGSSPVSP